VGALKYDLQMAEAVIGAQRPLRQQSCQSLPPQPRFARFAAGSAPPPVAKPPEPPPSTDRRAAWGMLRFFTNGGGGGKQLLGLSTPSPGISPASLPAHPRIARFCPEAAGMMRFFTNGGGGGNRTRVQRTRPKKPTCLVSVLNLGIGDTR